MLAQRSTVCLALAFSLVALPAMALAQDEVARGNTAFALDLYQRLREGEGNRFVSPLSVTTALAMTYAGARGETAAQIRDMATGSVLFIGRVADPTAG